MSRTENNFIASRKSTLAIRGQWSQEYEYWREHERGTEEDDFDDEDLT